MKHPKKSAPLAEPQQLNLMFEAVRTARLSATERREVALALAQILVQAAGLAVEELDDDSR